MIPDTYADVMSYAPGISACDYLRSWHRIYNDPAVPSSFRAVRGMTQALVPSDVLRRVMENKETPDDVVVVTQYVARYGEWHQLILVSAMSWPQWVCWKVTSAFRPTSFVASSLAR